MEMQQHLWRWSLDLDASRQQMGCTWPEIFMTWGDGLCSYTCIINDIP